jgi:hypothetical protein
MKAIEIGDPRPSSRYQLLPNNLYSTHDTALTRPFQGVLCTICLSCQPVF